MLLKYFLTKIKFYETFRFDKLYQLVLNRHWLCINQAINNLTKLMNGTICIIMKLSITNSFPETRIYEIDIWGWNGEVTYTISLQIV